MSGRIIASAYEFGNVTFSGSGSNSVLVAAIDSTYALCTPGMLSVAHSFPNSAASSISSPRFPTSPELLKGVSYGLIVE